MTTYPTVFTAPGGQAQVLGAYQDVLDHRRVPATEMDIAPGGVATAVGLMQRAICDRVLAQACGTAAG